MEPLLCINLFLETKYEKKNVTNFINEIIRLFVLIFIRSSVDTHAQMSQKT